MFTSRRFRPPLESRIVDSLRAAGKATLSLVAEVDGEIVGYILLSPVSLDPRNRATVGLGRAPVAVLPEYQRRGIGGALIREGLAQAAARGFGFVVVLGEPAYCGRFGFGRASGFDVANEYGVGDPFMAVELVPGALSGPPCVARYAPEFGMAEE